MNSKRYRMEKIDDFNQVIWDDVSKEKVMEFSSKDFFGEFDPSMPSRIVSFMNREKGNDLYDASILLLGILRLLNKGEASYKEMRECIEGLKEGGSALNFILPHPHIDLNDCVTNSELYRVQYRMAKKKWDAYYSRFYEKKPSEYDEVVSREYRSDLHHMRFSDGRWHFRCTVNGTVVKRFLSNNEEEAKLMRDKLMKELGFK